MVINYTIIKDIFTYSLQECVIVKCRFWIRSRTFKKINADPGVRHVDQRETDQRATHQLDIS
jgi:hypothetical protein